MRGEHCSISYLEQKLIYALCLLDWLGDARHHQIPQPVFLPATSRRKSAITIKERNTPDVSITRTGAGHVPAIAHPPPKIAPPL